MGGAFLKEEKILLRTNQSIPTPCILMAISIAVAGNGYKLITTNKVVKGSVFSLFFALSGLCFAQCLGFQHDAKD